MGRPNGIGPKRAPNRERDRTIASWINDGISPTDVARSFRLSPSRIQQIARRMGCKPQRAYFAKRDAQVVALARQQPVRVIAERFGMSPGAVNKVLRTHAPQPPRQCWRCAAPLRVGKFCPACQLCRDYLKRALAVARRYPETRQPLLRSARGGGLPRPGICLLCGALARSAGARLCPEHAAGPGHRFLLALWSLRRDPAAARLFVRELPRPRPARQAARG